MKRLFAAVITVALAAIGIVVPAEAVSYQISQKTLTPFSGSVTALTAKQKAEVKAAVDANPDAEKFICTGIRYESYPASVNIMVRARAKAACEYAKQLNPSLSTWYQNKPTKVQSYAGKVLLTVKSPIHQVATTSPTPTPNESSLPEYPSAPGTSASQSPEASDSDSSSVEVETESLPDNSSSTSQTGSSSEAEAGESDLGSANDVISDSATVEPVVDRRSSLTSLKNLDKDVSRCQLRQTLNYTGAGAKGFPIGGTLPRSGTIKIAIIPIDFENAQGVGIPSEMFADDVELIARWAEFMTAGTMSYQVDLVSETWIRAPRTADWYTCTQCGKGSTEDKQSRNSAFTELIQTADDHYNFLDTDFVYFVFPYEAEKVYGTAVIANYHLAISTKDGIARLTAYGEMGGSRGHAEWARDQIWDHLLHEILHYQGFIGHGPINGGPWTILQNQFGASKLVSGWEQFLGGWLSQGQVTCIDATDISGEYYLDMNSLDLGSQGGEIAIIKIDEQKVLVVEKRESGEFSNFENVFSSTDGSYLPKNPGYTVYRVEPNKPAYRDDMGDLLAEELRNWWGYIRDQGQAWITNVIESDSLRFTLEPAGYLVISKVR